MKPWRAVQEALNRNERVGNSGQLGLEQAIGRKNSCILSPKRRIVSLVGRKRFLPKAVPLPRFFSIRSISMKLYRFLQHFLTGKFVHYFVLFFISISIAAVIASSYESMANYRIGFFAITYASSFVFLVEFAARIFSAPAQYPALSRTRARLRYLFSFYGFVDFVAILPCVLSYFYWDTPTVHVIILPYIFIIFKLIRHSRSFQLIGKALASVKEELATAYTACFIMVCFSAILMYYLERSAQPEVFRNIGDGVWWSIVTFATVGYGDIYPVTPLGKLLGGLIALIGIAMIAIPTGIISSSFMHILQQKEQKALQEEKKEEKEVKRD